MLRAQLTDNVVTNLQNQIDECFKYEDLNNPVTFGSTITVTGRAEFPGGISTSFSPTSSNDLVTKSYVDGLVNPVLIASGSVSGTTASSSGDVRVSFKLSKTSNYTSENNGLILVRTRVIRSQAVTSHDCRVALTSNTSKYLMRIPSGSSVLSATKYFVGQFEPDFYDTSRSGNILYDIYQQYPYDIPIDTNVELQLTNGGTTTVSFFMWVYNVRFRGI